MPILRKVLQHGDSKAVTLPKSWLKNAEEEAGKKIVAVAMEIDRVITLETVFEKDAVLKPKDVELSYGR